MPSDPEQKRRPMFYGRRKGKIIRKGRASACDALMPEIGITLPEGNALINPARFFPSPVRDVWLEIGFGNGEHLAQMALANCPAPSLRWSCVRSPRS